MANHQYGQFWMYEDKSFDRGDDRLSIRISDDKDGIGRAYRLLHHFDNGKDSGFYKAVGSAIKRAAQHGETVGYRLAATRYDISSGTMKRFTRYYNRHGSEDDWHFGFRGNLIPLAFYKVRQDGEGRIQAHVLRGTHFRTLKRAFWSFGSSYDRIRERVGKARYPTRQLYGPSAVEGLGIAERETGAVSRAVNAEFDKRIEHEILRVMNGWGV